MKKIKNKKIYAKETIKISLILLLMFILIFINSFSAIASPSKNIKAATSEAESMYKKALNDYKAGNLPRAYDTVQFILNNYSAGKTFSSNAYFLCGRILYKLNDFISAKAYFQRIIYKNPDYTKIFNVIFYMARTDFNLKNYRRSIRDFNFLLERSNKGTMLYDKSLIYLTLCYASSGKTKEADKIYKKDDVKKILKKIIYLKKRNNYFKLVYLDYLINHNNDINTGLLILNSKNLFSPDKENKCYKYYFSGIISLKIKKYLAAENYFIKSSMYCSGYYYKSGLMYYGISLVKQKNPKGIKYLKNWGQSIGYPRIKLKSLKFLVNFYNNKNLPEKEFKYIKMMLFDLGYYMPENEKIKQEKRAAALIYNIVKNDYKNNNYNDAFKSFGRISFLIPEQYMNSKIYMYLSKMELKEKQNKEALLYAEKYNDLNKNPHSEYFLSDIYFKSAKLKKSLSLIESIDLKKVKSINLQNKIINLKLKIYKKLNYGNKYADLLKSSLNTLAPEERIKSLYFIGRLEFNANKLKTADMYFYRVIKNGYSKEKNNKNILYETYYYLGLINYRFNNYKLSLAYFKKSYDLDKSGAHFQFELSQIAYIYLKYDNDKKLALKYYGLLNSNATSTTYKDIASSMISAINIQN